MTNASVLNVNLHGDRIGTLTDVGGDRTIFTFTDEYIADDGRPTLGLAFKDDLGRLRTKFRPYQTRVMPFFSNMLPEGHLRKYLAERANIKQEREFHLLRILGHDLPGAVTVIPSDEDSEGFESADLDHDSDHHEHETQFHGLRFSLAGVQLKFSATAEAFGGLTIPASGRGGSWIVKLPPRGFDGVPENEFSMMKLAEYVGIDVPNIKLVDIDDIANLPEGIEKIAGSTFAIKRFDRLSDGSKIHIEDFAQIYGVYPSEKYKKGGFRGIAKVMAAEGSEADIIEYIRRLTFNMLIGNADMHLKNWSLIYHDRRHASLSPAYDFVSTVPYIPGNKTNMKISREKVFTGFDVDELTHLAIKASISKKMAIDTARETASLFQDHWKRETPNLPMSKEVRDAVDSHLTRVPILREL